MEVIKRTFSVSDLNLYFIAIPFEKSTYFWVGDHNHDYKDLQCSFPLTNIKDGESAGSTLLGEMDSISLEIANTLAKIYKRGVFMSINVRDLDETMMSEFQQELFKLIFEVFPRNQKSSS